MNHFYLLNVGNNQDNQMNINSNEVNTDKKINQDKQLPQISKNRKIIQKQIKGIKSLVENKIKLNINEKMYYQNDKVKRKTNYNDIYHYLEYKKLGIDDNRYPKRITDIKDKSKRDNARKQFKKTIKKYTIDTEDNRLAYKKLITSNDKSKKEETYLKIPYNIEIEEILAKHHFDSNHKGINIMRNNIT